MPERTPSRRAPRARSAESLGFRRRSRPTRSVFVLLRHAPSKKPSHVAAMSAADHDQYQLGFAAGGHTGTVGTKPFRFGIWTFGKLPASMASLSWMMPFRKRR